MSLEYATVAQVRELYEAALSETTDAAILRRLDFLADFLEGTLGHSFGRALLAYSTGADSVAVSSTALTIGGDSYLFATYPTLADLVEAVNAAGEAYRLDLVTQMAGHTPSSLLQVHAAQVCGPSYANRVCLATTAFYLQATGRQEMHLFLPLPLARVVSVVENGVSLTSDGVTRLVDGYWAVPGECWITRKLCACLTADWCCQHPRGHWTARYPGNVTVTYVPQHWGRIPGAVSGLVLEAFTSAAGIAPLESETFGQYSYRRGQAPVLNWQQVLVGPATRPYVVRYAP